MDFSFPHFTRASTDNAYTQPPQKSLLELVIEAKGRLGLVPQREVPKRHPSSSPFSHFSDSDEEVDGTSDDANGQGVQRDAVLTTRTSWVPPSYLLDYFFSGEFLSVFLTLHNISSSRPVSMLVPPILTVRDAQLHPFVEAGLCTVLLNAALGSSRHQHSGCGGGRGGGRGGRVSRGGGFAGSVHRGGGEGSYMDSNGAAAILDGPSMSYWGATQRHELQDAVLGAEDGVACQKTPYAPHSSFCAAERGVDEPARAPLAQRLLFRGLQQVALPALLLGDHVLLSGPRGIGKRTAGLLSAGANVLAFTGSPDPGAAEETEAPPAPAACEEEAAADTPPAVAEEPEYTSIVKTEVKQEGATDDARDSADDRPAPAKPAVDTAPASLPLPRALMLFSSYPEALFAAHWLRCIFGPAAFTAYTFKKDEAALCPLLEVPAAEPQPAAPVGVRDTHSNVISGHFGEMPAYPETTSGRRFIGPPLSLPFITDTNSAAGAVGVSPRLPTEPTQAELAVLPAEATAPALAELAALVMGAALPTAASRADQGLAEGSANGGDAKRKQRRRGDDEKGSSEGADAEQGEKRSPRKHRRHRHHRSDDDDLESDGDDHRRARVHKKRSPHSSSSHRHRSRHGDRGHREKEEESRGEREASGHRRHRRHRHHSEEVDADGRGANRRSIDDEEQHSRRHSSHRSRSRHQHHSSSGSRKHRHRSRSDERRFRHGSSHHRHHRSSRHRGRHNQSTSSAASSSSSSTPSRSQLAGSPPPLPRNGEAILPLALDGSAAPPAACGLGVLELESVAPPTMSMETPMTSYATVVEEPTSSGERQREAIEAGTASEQPDALCQRVPLLITTYHALQTALELVQGEASALPPLEHVRVALFTNLERALMPPLKESFVHSWWLSLVNALDVECQFVVTADRMGNEVRGFLNSTILPDAGERLVHFDQRDGSIWAMMKVQVCAVPVEAPVAALPPNSGSGGRPRISGSDIDAAKVAHLYSTISEHISSAACRAAHSRDDAALAASGGGQLARVVVVCSARREQSLVVTQLQCLLSDQERGANAAVLRVTERAEVFRASEAEVLVLTDAQLTDPRVLRDVHQCTEVDLILHFSLPRPVMMRLEKEEIIDVLAQRGRAILGTSKQFCARRWWRVAAAASAAGGDAAIAEPNSAADFVPAKVECLLLLTEHNMHGRAGSCVMEALREVSDG
ncbi:hypothetical protein LSCM4_05586 [Leishmania orientalis]|uniref:Uncharacterized protein n=1 Tax=Leishmania orientalis TaxID=2249476 RepID=A0A836KY83_9TRYP|nr:hypothetical protein LSCM4_05586 [Leishmania orientalis]